MNFSERPALVFWETTRACGLACVHCRASAQLDPQPGELSHEQGLHLIETLPSFGRPHPILILTGGDPLRRSDLFDLAHEAYGRAIPFAISPAVTDLLDPRNLTRLYLSGASSVSVSLDGATALTHDGIRGVPGSFDRTTAAVRDLVSLGVRVQVNTTVMRGNLAELARIFHQVRELGVSSWEVFFLVRTGRGGDLQDLTPDQWESAAQFVVDASRYGTTVRAVEAPFVRRILLERKHSGETWKSPEYVSLRRELQHLEGSPVHESTLRPSGTLDGDGTVFVGHDGTIQPGGLLPLTLGRFPKDDLITVYRNDSTLRAIRARQLKGVCGVCSYRQVCGGSRARAYAATGDPLESDPACHFGRTMPSPARATPTPAS